MLGPIQKLLVQEENKSRKHFEMAQSTRLVVDTKEEGKKELLQYKMFENDSDNDVIEGLGNTTLAAGVSSNEDSIGSNDDKNKDKSVKEAKNIIEIPVQNLNRSVRINQENKASTRVPNLDDL